MWLVIAFIFFVVLRMFGKKDLRRDFEGVASALSYVWYGLAIITFTGMLATFFVDPAVNSVRTVAEEADLSTLESAQIISIIKQKDSKEFGDFLKETSLSEKHKGLLRTAFNEADSGALVTMPFFVLIAIGALVLLFALIVVPFTIVSELFGADLGTTIVLWFVLSIVSLIGISGVNSIFSVIPF